MSDAKIRGDAVRPLLKWPGGKRFLATTIVDLIGDSSGTYFEPFAGGAAVFFLLRPLRAVLSDANQELMSCYEAVRDDPEGLIARLKRLKNSEDDFYRIRASRPRTHVGRAARMIYLANLGFNGIYRTNFRGEFNVPYGHRPHLKPFDPSHLREVSRRLSTVELMTDDFERAVRTAKRGDTVYLDPPYTVAHSNNGFIRYNAKIFSWADQERLACLARELRDRGCRVIVSNADHDSIRRLYRGFDVLTVQRSSCIAADRGFRGAITECIFYVRGTDDRQRART